jgi:hypothetical protein
MRQRAEHFKSGDWPRVSNYVPSFLGRRFCLSCRGPPALPRCTVSSAMQRRGLPLGYKLATRAPENPPAISAPNFDARFAQSVRLRKLGKISCPNALNSENRPAVIAFDEFVSERAIVAESFQAVNKSTILRLSGQRSAISNLDTYGHPPPKTTLTRVPSPRQIQNLP